MGIVIAGSRVRALVPGAAFQLIILEEHQYVSMSSFFQTFVPFLITPFLTIAQF